MGILIRLFFCLSKCNEMRFGKNICVIDNIEYSIPYDEINPIQECELETIMNGVNQATVEMEQIRNSWHRAHILHGRFYSILLVMRDTSVPLIECHQYADFHHINEIDISSWFCVVDICRSKLNYFYNIVNVISDDIHYIAYKNILSDMSIYNWRLHDLLSKMYNGNYRRIIIDVAYVVACIPEDDLKYFNKLWTKCNGDVNLPAIKHLCRKFIFRNILEVNCKMKLNK